MEVVQLLGLRGPWGRQACRGTGCLRGRSHGPVSVLVSEPLIAGDQKASLASLSL